MSLRRARHTDAHECHCGGVDSSRSGYGEDGCRVAGPVAAVRRVASVLRGEELPAIVAYIEEGSGAALAAQLLRTPLDAAPTNGRLVTVRGLRPPLRELVSSGPPHHLELTGGSAAGLTSHYDMKEIRNG